jgi:hypothetical protein
MLAHCTEMAYILYILHCNENPIYVFLFWELRGLSPNFQIHVSGSFRFISWIIFPQAPKDACLPIWQASLGTFKEDARLEIWQKPPLGFFQWGRMSCNLTSLPWYFHWDACLAIWQASLGISNEDTCLSIWQASLGTSNEDACLAIWQASLGTSNEDACLSIWQPSLGTSNEDACLVIWQASLGTAKEDECFHSWIVQKFW